MKDETVYLRHILECARRIEENTSEGRDRFMVSHTLQDAVLRNLQTMGESTQRAHFEEGDPRYAGSGKERSWRELREIRPTLSF